MHPLCSRCDLASRQIGRTRVLLEQELGSSPTRFRIAGARDVSGIGPDNGWKRPAWIRIYAGEHLEALATRARL